MSPTDIQTSSFIIGLIALTLAIICAYTGHWVLGLINAAILAFNFLIYIRMEKRIKKIEMEGTPR